MLGSAKYILNLSDISKDATFEHFSRIITKTF